MNTHHEGKRTVRIRVAGLVQGVGFRYFVRREAQLAGVSGYVRNLGDGSVEAVASGDPGDLEGFISRVKTGPPSALVSEVVVEEIAHPDLPGRFEIRF